MVVFVHIQVDGAENNIGDANKEEGGRGVLGLYTS